MQHQNRIFWTKISLQFSLQKLHLTRVKKFNVKEILLQFKYNNNITSYGSCWMKLKCPLKYVLNVDLILLQIQCTIIYCTMYNMIILS